MLIRPHLEYLTLPHLRVLHEPKETLQSAYLLNSGLISLMIETRDGKTVEVGVVGNEGMVGLELAVGLTKSPLRAVVQIAGDSLSIKGWALESALHSCPHLRETLSQYTVRQSLQVAQTAACNRLHNVEQRFARWLLTLQARSDSDSLVITHDFLAAMLGTDRPSVSVAAGNFQRKQVIEYKRGTVKILNRKKLEKLACECYEAIQELNGKLDAHSTGV